MSDQIRVTSGGAARSALLVTGPTDAAGNPSGSASNPTATVSQPSTASSAAVPSSSQSTAAEGSRVAKASAGNLYGYECAAGAAAGYLMVFDSTTAPADGTVTPRKVHAMAANATLSRSFNPPLRFANGITLVFSTTGPFTKTVSPTAFLGCDYA